MKKNMSCLARQKNRCSGFRLWKPAYIFILLWLTFIEEKWLLDTAVPFILGSFSIELALLSISSIVTLVFNNKLITRMRKKNVSFSADAINIVKSVIYILRRTTVVGVLVLMLVVVYAPAVLAQNHIIGRSRAFVEAGIDIHSGINAFIYYEDSAPAKEVEDDALLEKQDSEEIDDSKQLIQDAYEAENTKDWLSKRPQSEQKIAERLQISENERKEIYILSEEEYNELFFLSGEYAVRNWEQQEEVEEQVRKKIDDLIQCKQENVFDSEDGAPESLRTEIDRVRQDDEVSTELKRKKEIIAVRNSAYECYPKYSLAKMISEAYNGFGLAYYWQCGNAQTSSYYFAQAIPWLYKCLTFKDISRDVRRELLKSIEQRYRDMAFVGDEVQIETYYSLKLAAALHALQNEY